MVEVVGKPLITYSLAALQRAGLKSVVVAKAGSALPPLDCPVLEEPAEPRHPLAGIVFALRQLPARPLLVLACDMPLVNPLLLEWMANLSEPLALPFTGGHLQPFPGLYHPTLLAPLEAGLREAGSMRGVLAPLGPRLLRADELSRFGDPAGLCLSVNTASDLALAERLLARPRPPH